MTRHTETIEVVIPPVSSAARSRQVKRSWPAAVWAVMIVFPHTPGSMKLNLVQISTVILGQPFIERCPVESLYVSILLRVAGLNVLKVNAPVLGHLVIVLLMFSGPLSLRIALDLPRQEMI